MAETIRDILRQFIHEAYDECEESCAICESILDRIMKSDEVLAEWNGEENDEK